MAPFLAKWALGTTWGRLCVVGGDESKGCCEWIRGGVFVSMLSLSGVLC